MGGTSPLRQGDASDAGEGVYCDDVLMQVRAACEEAHIRSKVMHQRQTGVCDCCAAWEEHDMRSELVCQRQAKVCIRTML